MTCRGGPAAAAAQWFQGKHSSVMQGAPPGYSMKNQHTFIELNAHGVSAGYRSRGWEALLITALMVNDLMIVASASWKNRGHLSGFER